MRIGKIIEKPKNLSKDQISIVVVIIVDNKDNVLLIKRSNQDNNRPGEWECVGGHRKKDESIRDTALREVKEETNLEVKLVKSKHVFFRTEDNLYGVVLKAKPLSKDVELRQEEHQKFIWIPKQEITNYRPVPPDLYKEVKLLVGVSLMTKKRIKAEETRREDVINKKRKEYKDDDLDTLNADLGLEESARDQAFFESLDSPSWEAVWKLSNMKKPDWENFSVKEQPICTTTLMGKGSWSEYEDNHYGESLYRVIRDALDEKGLADDCNLTDGGKGIVSITFDDPKLSVPITKIIKKQANLIVKPISYNEIRVAVKKKLIELIQL